MSHEPEGRIFVSWWDSDAAAWRHSEDTDNTEYYWQGILYEIMKKKCGSVLHSSIMNTCFNEWNEEKDAIYNPVRKPMYLFLFFFQKTKRSACLKRRFFFFLEKTAIYFLNR